MATLTPTQTVRTLASTESSHNVGGVWDYSVPLEEEEYFSHENASNNQQRQPYTNGGSRTRDSDHIGSSRANNLRTKSSELSNTSEPDGGQDLYKSPSNPSMRSASYSSVTKNMRKTSSGALSRSPEEDQSKWIHRDKLAQIESRELIEAGLRIGRRPSERFDAGKKDDKRQRLVSPEHANTEYDEYAAEENPKSFIPKPATVRGASSRIPIPKGVSPSQAYGEYPIDTRSRSGSAGWSNSLEQSPQSPYQTYDMDDNNETSPPDTPPARTNSAAASERSSPQKSVRNPKGGPAGRKTNRNASNPKLKTVSHFKPPKEEPKRPGTSSGNNGGRPTTSHRTDGEPPWLATMYKPDPRLPPDQQMLPTLARKLAQEKWEKEGKTGTAYDRDFRLLNVEAFPPKPVSPERKDSNNANEDRIHTTVLHSGFRQTPASGSPRTPSSNRPGTSGADSTHGGYRTMPTISPSPKPQTPSSVISGTNQLQQMPLSQGPQALELQGMKPGQGPQQMPVEKEKEAGCAGCGCILM